MTNPEVREWYLAELSKIPKLNRSWIAFGIDLYQRARWVWEFRHNTRLKAREMMEDPIDVWVLRRKDKKRYGDPDGPSFEWLMAKLETMGITGDDAYEAIIGSSSRSNPDINKQLGL